MVVHIVQQRAQVLEIVEQQSAVVRNAENDLQNARLRLAQAENAGEQLGPISLTVARTAWPPVW